MAERKYGQSWAEVAEGLAETGKCPAEVHKVIVDYFDASSSSVKDTQLNNNELQLVMRVTRDAPNAANIIMTILKTVGVGSLTGTSLQAAAEYGHSKEVLETLATKLPYAKLKLVPASLVSDAVFKGSREENIEEVKPLQNLMEVKGMILTGGAWKSVCMLSVPRYNKWMPFFDELVMEGRMTPSDNGRRPLEFCEMDIAKLVITMGSVNAFDERIKDLFKRGIAKMPEYKQLSNAIAVIRDWRVFDHGNPAYAPLLTAYTRYVAKCRMSHHKPPLGPAKPLPALTVASGPPKRELANTASSAKRSRGSAAVASALQMGEKQSKKARAGP